MTERPLAILGGEPAFGEVLHVGRPNLGSRERLLERFGEMLDRLWLTNNGPLVQEFEARFREFLGVRHCIAMCNATVGLEIAIRAAGLKGEVIVPAFTFVATAHALQWQQITPVFCDIDPETHNIDPTQVAKLITPETTGIIGVHLWGRACDINALQRIARRNNLTLMFDAAHAVGSDYKGQLIGGFGKAEVFSFHATKVMNSFEGGMVATNDDEFADRVRLMNNFGFTGLDSVDYIGTNGKMSEPAAAMGLTSLESLDQFTKINQENYDTYRQSLQGVPGVILVDYSGQDRNNYHYIVLEIIESETGIARDLLLDVLHAENIRARRYFYPGCHRMEPYKSLYPQAGSTLPETNKLAERVLCLPNGTAVGASEIELIGSVIKSAIGRGQEIEMHLNGKMKAKKAEHGSN